MRRSRQELALPSRGRSPLGNRRTGSPRRAGASLAVVSWESLLIESLPDGDPAKQAAGRPHRALGAVAPMSSNIQLLNLYILKTWRYAHCATPSPRRQRQESMSTMTAHPQPPEAVPPAVAARMLCV